MPSRVDCQFNSSIQSTSQAANVTMAAGVTGAAIVIPPPSRAQTHQTLHPPIMAQHWVPNEPSAQYFATAVLLNDEGDIVSGLLGGTKAATGFHLDRSASGISTVMYAFPSLSIARAGAYSIRLDLYKVSLEFPAAGATLVEQLEAEVMNVSDDRVPLRRLSSAEREILRRARDAGITLP